MFGYYMLMYFERTVIVEYEYASPRNANTNAEFAADGEALFCR